MIGPWCTVDVGIVVKTPSLEDARLSVDRKKSGSVRGKRGGKRGEELTETAVMVGSRSAVDVGVVVETCSLDDARLSMEGKKMTHGRVRGKSKWCKGRTMYKCRSGG